MKNYISRGGKKNNCQNAKVKRSRGAFHRDSPICILHFFRNMRFYPADNLIHFGNIFPQQAVEVLVDLHLFSIDVDYFFAESHMSQTIPVDTDHVTVVLFKVLSAGFLRHLIGGAQNRQYFLKDVQTICHAQKIVIVIGISEYILFSLCLFHLICGSRLFSIH